jgi:hypothetical protein
LTALLDAYGSDTELDRRTQVALLFGVGRAFDFTPVLEIDDVEELRYVFPLFASVARGHADLFLTNIVAPEALRGLLGAALADGSFAAKRAAVALAGELVEENAAFFVHHFVKEKALFASGRAILESDVPALQREYLRLLDRLLRAVTHHPRVREKLIKRWDDAELEGPVEALFWGQDREMGDVARLICVRVSDARMQAVVCPRIRRGK